MNTNEQTPMFNLQEQAVSKSSIMTALLVFVLSLFIIFLYLSSKAEWAAQIRESQEDVEPLRQENIRLRTVAASYKKQDSLQARLLFQRTFDPKDLDNSRTYGLFKDRQQQYTTADVARMFRIPNEKAVKMSELEGENWFIVPVKGVHFLRKWETATSLAKRYYPNWGDSVLIKTFNPNMKAGNYVFIPYH